MILTREDHGKGFSKIKTIKIIGKNPTVLTVVNII